ncbi:MAG: TonB-dependent receptor, partial [Ferruginibacter sp.]
MKKKIFVAAAFIVSSTTFAQNNPADSISIAIGTQNLQEVIVTANKFEQKQSETGKVLTVITQQQLQRSLAKTVGEILNQQVGIHIGGANGPLGTVQTVYTRGASAANTLILMDGIPMYDASGISSEFDLNNFSVTQIERIEILKGAQSTLYGSDAVAGVINIITKKAETEKAVANIVVAAGSYDTYRGSVNVSGTIKKGVEYFAGYSRISSNGFSSAYDSTKSKNFDKDGFDQDALQASLRLSPTENLSIKWFGKYNVNKTEIDAGAFTDDTDYKNRNKNFSTGLNGQYRLKKVAFIANYNYNVFERKYRNDSANIGGFSTDPYAFYNKFINEQYKGKTHFAELYANASLHKTLNLLAGIDYRKQNTTINGLYISNYGPYEPLPLGADSAKANQKSVYASLIFNDQHGFTASIGGRFNDHSIYGDNKTFSINPAYTFKRVKVFANVASAYRVPSLYQLYSEFGNKNLVPEQSTNYEAGLQYTASAFMARVVGFKRKIKDVFAFYSQPVAPFASYYINDDQQDDKGIELETAVQFLKHFSFAANYTYVVGKIETTNFDGKDTSVNNLYRRPKNTLNASLSYAPANKIYLRTQLRSGSSFLEPKFGIAPVRLSGYYTWDVYGEYTFGNCIKVFGDVKNITDQLYFDQEGFGTRGFNVNIGISLR